MIELLLLCISHDPDDLAKRLKCQLGRAHTERHKNLFRVRCHNLTEAEELAHRLPQVLGSGVSVGIADWANAKLTGEDDVRYAFMAALNPPADLEPAALAEAESADGCTTEDSAATGPEPGPEYPVIPMVPVSREGMTVTPAADEPASDNPPSEEGAKQETPAISAATLPESDPATIVDSLNEIDKALEESKQADADPADSPVQ